MSLIIAAVVLLKYIFYISSFFVTLCLLLLLATRLWMEPIKGVCKSKAKLNGKVALVTGGNSGIGLETARDLARRGARVIIASRDAKKSLEAVEDIIQTTENKRVEHLHLDLAKFNSIRNFAEEFNKNYDRLDILVNNAGCAGLKEQSSEDGIDLVTQINYLGPFLLTNLLLNKIIASRPSRIVIVSSYLHNFAKLTVDDLEGLATKHYLRKYANSKLCDVLWTKALAKRLPEGVTVNCLHPGVVKTEIFKRTTPWIRKLIHIIVLAFFKTAEEGAQTSIHLSVSEKVEHVTGLYFKDCKQCDASDLAKNDRLVEEIWDRSLLLTKSPVLPIE